MGMDRLLFHLMYRFGFTPWDGHALPVALTRFIEGGAGIPPAKPVEALDVGCGTGATAIYLAQRGWIVTALDFAAPALAKARAKAESAGATVLFLEGDATKLTIGAFPLVIDSGCLHGLSARDRDAYVRELEKSVKPRGRLFLFAFEEGGRQPPRGISAAEVRQRFAPPAWELLSVTLEQAASTEADRPIHAYELQRR